MRYTAFQLCIKHVSSIASQTCEIDCFSNMAYNVDAELLNYALNLCDAELLNYALNLCDAQLHNYALKCLMHSFKICIKPV